MLTLMRLTEAVLPEMREHGFGRILTVASTSIVEPIPALAISNGARLATADRGMARYPGLDWFDPGS